MVVAGHAWSMERSSAALLCDDPWRQAEIQQSAFTGHAKKDKRSQHVDLCSSYKANTKMGSGSTTGHLTRIGAAILAGALRTGAPNVSTAAEGGELPNLNSIKSFGMPSFDSGSSSDAEIPA